MPQPVTPPTVPVPEKSVVPEPEENLIPDEPTPPKAEDDMPPAKPALEDDLFNDTPADSPPAEAPEDAMPADEKPADEKPANDDDLFNETPADKPADEKPAADDDLFNEPAADAPADEMPADEPVADPAEDAKPADDVDELFNDSTDAADDSSAAKTAQAYEADSTQDVAGAPAESDVDDLFEEAADENSTPAVQDPINAELSPEADLMEAADPADAVPVGDESTQASPAEEPVAATSRVWTDNTGKFTVSARLVVVLDGAVRLQKETGRFTTVPMDRLSNADRQFVLGQSQLSAQTSASPGQKF